MVFQLVVSKDEKMVANLVQQLVGRKVLLKAEHWEQKLVVGWVATKVAR